MPPPAAFSAVLPANSFLREVSSTELPGQHLLETQLHCAGRLIGQCRWEKRLSFVCTIVSLFQPLLFKVPPLSPACWWKRSICHHLAAVCVETSILWRHKGQPTSPSPGQARTLVRSCYHIKIDHIKAFRSAWLCTDSSRMHKWVDLFWKSPVKIRLWWTDCVTFQRPPPPPTPRSVHARRSQFITVIYFSLSPWNK